MAASKAKPKITRKTTPKTAPKDAAAANVRAEILVEIRGIAYLILGVFFFICIFFSDPGFFGNTIKSLLVHLFGQGGQILLAAFVMTHGILLLLKFSPFTEGTGSLFLYILYLSVVTIFGFSDSAGELLGFGDRALYMAFWEARSRGGFIGQFLAKFLVFLMSEPGAWLVVILAICVSLMMIFRKSIVNGVRNTVANRSETSALNKAAKKKDVENLMREMAAETAAHARTRKKDPGSAMDAFLDDAIKKPSIRISPADVFEENSLLAQGAGKGKRQKDIKDVFGAKGKSDRKETDSPSTNSAKETVKSPSPAVSMEAPRPIYVKPPLNLLDSSRDAISSSRMQQEVLNNAALLEKVLKDFSIEAAVSEVSVGPTVTRYELQLKPGIRVSRVVSLSDDIAMSLAALSVRIEAPIPGKSAIGIEVPNKEKTTVRLSQLIDTDEFTRHKSPLAVALGKNLTGNDLILDVTVMPHLLIAGATGSGKSVCINTLIMSILFHSPPEDVRMILIDPKMVELSVYNDVPHLLIPVVTDPKDAAGALGWAVREMTRRYEVFVEHGVRGIDGYNSKMVIEDGEKMPHIILIIDELNDLMIVSAQAVETSIIRLSQLARAAGIHLVLATQRPTVNVITGVIKANIPTRISFAVMSQVDSRTILDMSGAEKLLGKGDMLYLPQDQNSPIRAQCAYVSDKEIEKVVSFIKKTQTADYDTSVMEGIKQPADSGAAGAAGSEYGDELLPKAMEIAFEKNIISTSTIQRRLRLGYARAGRIIDEMEERGFISAADGSRPRKVLVTMDEYFGGESHQTN